MRNYLIGAPRDWAGFSRMVMVVSVSFSGASDSYSGIMGADGKKSESIIDQHSAPYNDEYSLMPAQISGLQTH